MKIYIKPAIMLLILLAGGQVFSQNNDMQMFVIQPYPLELTTAKTTHLVFPYDIISVDKGSRDILAQKAKGTSNILQVKAAKAGFVQSSLTVITADRKLYSFTVDYASDPLQLTIEFAGGSGSNGALLESSRHNQASLQAISQKILSLPQSVRRVKDKSLKCSLALKGVYIEKDVIYFQLEIQNRSQISYDLGSVRFFVRDKKRVKRGAVQELEIKPLHIEGETAMIAGKSSHMFVYALPKFTLADKKYLAIQVIEGNGGRHLSLAVSNKKIISARPLKE